MARLTMKSYHDQVLTAINIRSAAQVGLVGHNLEYWFARPAHLAEFYK